MKKQFFPATNSGQATGVECYANVKEVKQATASWADKIVKVDGGWLVFESVSDYETWKNQK
jgi:hypothetical protein